VQPLEASHGEKVRDVNDLVAGQVERPHLVKGSGFRVEGLGFRVYGLGFMV